MNRLSYLKYTNQWDAENVHLELITSSQVHEYRAMWPASGGSIQLLWFLFDINRCRGSTRDVNARWGCKESEKNPRGSLTDCNYDDVDGDEDEDDEALFVRAVQGKKFVNLKKKK